MVQPGNVDRVDVVADLELLMGTAYAGQPGDRQLGRVALPAVPPAPPFAPVWDPILVAARQAAGAVRQAGDGRR